MHNKFLETQNGVSLERVSFENSENWKSALASFGFATPGLKNSQSEIPSEENSNTYDDEITIENQLFTPLNEEKEFTMIFNFPNSETSINISVYDTKGRLQKNLTENLIVGKYDKVSWNGTDENSNKCKSGIYIVIIKTADQSGKSKIYKKVCVIGTGK